MPELPNITVYIEALEKRVLGQALEGIRIVSPFLLRTAAPPLSEASGRKVFRLRRLGKRICIGLEDDLWLVLLLRKNLVCRRFIVFSRRRAQPLPIGSSTCAPKPATSSPRT